MGRKSRFDYRKNRERRHRLQASLLQVATIPNECTCCIQLPITSSYVPAKASTVSVLHNRIMTLQVLSEGWTSAVVNGNLILIKVRSGTADESTVLYLVTVSVDFTWRVRRGEREVPRECELLIASPELLRSVEAVTQIIQILDSCKLCVGNEDECFSELIAWRGGKFMDRSGINNSYVVLL